MLLQRDVTDDDLFASVRELGDKIRTRQLSPIALTEACLDRLEKVGPKYNAVVTVTRDLALREARAADEEIRAGRYRGPLHGIPYGAKDLVATKGIPTTWGAEPYKDQVFDYDATIIRRLRDAGAVLAGKLAMVELAGGFGYNTADASFTGPGLNPWNREFWAGGSSSGPGSAAAAALVPFTIGSETSGSIITPCAYCGVSGLRPTYGRISRHGAMALSWTLDKLGPMGRTADDCGLILAACAGPDPLDPTTLREPFSYEGPPTLDGQKPRIGIVKGCVDRVQPAVKKNFEETVRVLGKFADVVDDVPFPDLPFGEAVGFIVKAEGASAFRDLLESGRARQLRAANDRWGGYVGMMVSAVDYLQAMRLRAPMKRELARVYAPFDALIAPARNNVANPVGVDFDRTYPGLGGPPLIPAGNAVGQPAVSVPNGFGDNGLPTGIQFTGRAGSEPRLLALAHAYQQATDWHRKRPPSV